MKGYEIAWYGHLTFIGKRTTEDGKRNMAYKCKECGQDVRVDYHHFPGGGALLMIHVQTLDGNYEYVEQCPTCGARLLIYDDLEFIHDNEYPLEDERSAAL